MAQPPAAMFESVVGEFYKDVLLSRLLWPAKEGRKEVFQAGDAREAECSSRKAVQRSENTAVLDTSESTSTSGNIVPTTAPIKTNTEQTNVAATSEWEMERERQEKQSQEKRRMAVLFWSSAFCRTVGYIWVLCWFYLTGRWFVRPYVDVGIVEWGLPFSLADWLVVPDKC